MCSSGLRAKGGIMKEYIQFIFLSFIGLMVFISNLSISEAGGRSRKFAADAGFTDAKTQASTSHGDQFMAGNYRCWMFNVSGAGKRCTSPALVLKENGKYMMGSEKGSWKYEGGALILSESKIRGPGKVQVGGNGMRVIFEYSYRGWSHVVTYLRQDMRGASSDKAKKVVEQK